MPRSYDANVLLPCAVNPVQEEPDVVIVPDVVEVGTFVNVTEPPVVLPGIQYGAAVPVPVPPPT